MRADERSTSNRENNSSTCLQHAALTNDYLFKALKPVEKNLQGARVTEVIVYITA